MTYFEFFGLPEQLTLDTEDLQRRFYSLSREWHPDRFVRAPAEQQQKALDASALLNDGYRALRDPVQRAEYLLSLKGSAPGDNKQVPPELLEQVFELNMALEELKAGDTDALPQLRETRTHFAGLLSETDQGLAADFARWDGERSPAALQAIRARLNHRKYLSNLVRDTDLELEKHVSD